MKFFKDMLFIILVAFFFAGLTGAVNQNLRTRISLNEETRNTRYLLDVLDIAYPKGAGPEVISTVEHERIAKAHIDGQLVYRSYDANGNPTGYAFPIGGKGFWGPIKGLLALDNDLQTIKGIMFTSQEETPGLGARIEEPWFRDQFKGIKLTEKPPSGEFIRITLGGGKGPNVLDAITGATQTSTRLEKFLNKDIRDILAKKDEIRRFEWPSHPKK